MTSSITLKDDSVFLVSGPAGEVVFDTQGHGLYYQDTRYLSCFDLLIDGKKPELLSYNVDYNIAAVFHLSSSYLAQMHVAEEPLAPAWATVTHAVGLVRRRFIKQGLKESLELHNFHSQPVRLSLSIKLGADFADIFEVRGFRRFLQGPAATLRVAEDGQTVDISGLPTTQAETPRRCLRFQSSRPATDYQQSLTTSPLNGLAVPEVTLHYVFDLEPNRPQTLELSLTPLTGPAIDAQPAGRPDFEDKHGFARQVAAARQVFQNWQAACTRIQTGDFRLDRLFETSALDLRSLMRQEAQGLIVTAGLPWYFTMFGRDSLITALQTLCLNPQIAVDTLRVLAAYQARDYNNWQDSEPGKILHELRLGDLTISGEMPHSPYYGSIDSTLLYILTFGRTVLWLNDERLYQELWPAVERGLEWAEKYGDLDGDGFIEFKRRSRRGIMHPGWKDSDESMGGSLGPRPLQPVALVEVQGYYYDALRTLAAAVRRFGRPEQAGLPARLEERAARLKERFNREFWWEAEGYLVQALDAHKQPVHSVTSNPGHCLWSGIVDEDRAARVAVRLMQPDMLSGWGIRTISALDPTYNPMSYHNGSIWPHDNALIIAGLRRYGFGREALEVSNQLIAAALTFPDYRLPELYCGYARYDNGFEEHAPAAYPVSCSPQAWAAGTPLLLLQTWLGLEIDPESGRLRADPLLPDSLEQIHLIGLPVGDRRLDLSFSRDRAADPGKVSDFTTLV